MGWGRGASGRGRVGMLEGRPVAAVLRHARQGTGAGDGAVWRATCASTPLTTTRPCVSQCTPGVWSLGPRTETSGTTASGTPPRRRLPSANGGASSPSCSPHWQLRRCWLLSVARTPLSTASPQPETASRALTLHPTSKQDGCHRYSRESAARKACHHHDRQAMFPGGSGIPTDLLPGYPGTY